MERKKRYIFAFILLLTSVSVIFVLSLCTGTARISLSEVLRAIFYEEYSGEKADIILKIRLPRILAGMILGGALSLSGYLLQTFFHNPIAGPFVLGISSGAKLTVAVTMIIFMSRYHTVNSVTLIISAFAGSMLSMGFVLLISRKIRQMSLLVVCGVMTGYICSAVTDFIVTFADDSDIVNLHNWSMGTFSGTNMENVKAMAVITGISLLSAFMISKPAEAYMLGENYAQNMGVNLKLFKISLILISSMLSACVTAYAGPVSFVGIAVPHLMRVMFRTSKPLVMIPASFMGGSLFCMICDIIARTAFAPSELSISTVTAVFGAPVVIVITLKRKKGEF